MSEKFSLINEYKAIQEGSVVSKPKDAPKNKVKYQEYIIEVNSKDTSVYIPIRECDNFESLLEHSTSLEDYQLKNILREFRGIRNIG